MTLSLETMTATEARIRVDRIRAGLESVREDVLALYEAEGWRALGYGSWRECAVAEFGQSQTHLYRLLTAAQIDRVISPIGETPLRLNESHARELARLKDPEQIRDAWAEVQDEPAISATTIRAVVDRRLGVEGIREPVVGDLVDLPPYPERPAESKAFDAVVRFAAAIEKYDPAAVAAYCGQNAPMRDALREKLAGSDAWIAAFIAALSRSVRAL